MKKVPESQSKWNDPLLKQMRETAFGVQATVAVHQSLRKSESMRNDDQLLSDAELKRKRKNERNLKNRG